MSNYDLLYALERLEDGIELAELEGDFRSARKWAHETRKAVEELIDDTNHLMENLKIKPAAQYYEECPACNKTGKMYIYGRGNRFEMGDCPICKGEKYVKVKYLAGTGLNNYPTEKIA